MNYEFKINLKRIGAFVRDLQGKTCTKRCLIIPLENTGIVCNADGYYLHLVAQELKDKKGQSHIIKMKISPEEYHQLTREQQNALPIIGGAKEMKGADK
ncbi:MAG: hypothetical protein RIS29_2514 [Bacteroidota bacterium]|jgi:hypothetical protein